MLPLSSRGPLRRTYLRTLRLSILALLPAAVLAAEPRPNLIVLLIAEQFRADYLSKYQDEFGEAGFARLMNQGAYYTLCRYDHLTTLPAPNAATLATGAYPAVHGIVGNRWYDREEGQTVGFSGFAGGEPGADRLALKGSTIADEMRGVFGSGFRAYAVANQASLATILAGRDPSGVYWTADDGSFTTRAEGLAASGETAHAVPEWVKSFNESRPAMRYHGRRWYSAHATQGMPPLRLVDMWGDKTREDFFALFRSSPFALRETLGFARSLIAQEELGKTAQVDLLAVVLGATASLGLEEGSDSPLTRDLVLRLDQEVAAFLEDLDRKVGLDRTLIVFTGLHGISLLPEQARERGFPAGRVRGEAIADAMNAALSERFGPLIFVEKYIYPFVYFNAEAAGFSSRIYHEALTIAGEAARKVEGVAGYYAPAIGAHPAAHKNRFERSYHAQRSGDLTIAYEPYFVEHYGEGRGTAPGSFYHYDTDVPLIFLSHQIKPYRVAASVDATSIAPTLAALLGVSAPSASTGAMLSGVLGGEDAEAVADVVAEDSR